MESRISVETALNSRCSGDRDGRQDVSHWGLYGAGQARPEQREVVLAATRVPRLTAHLLEARWEPPYVITYCAGGLEGLADDGVQVESGMQQMAVHLACAALGLGTCIKNVGEDGTAVTGLRGRAAGLRGGRAEMATARLEVVPLLPSYGDSRWSTAPPPGWLEGNLPAPQRDGPLAYLDAAADVPPEQAGRPAAAADVAQLLWAARGRTPHLVRGAFWGLTAPTWAGRQDIASLHLLDGQGLRAYVNWIGERPTHALAPARPADAALAALELGPGLARGAALVFAVRERHRRARWECGYMLYAALVQARALGVGCRARLLDAAERQALEAAGLPGAVAALLIQG